MVASINRKVDIYIRGIAIKLISPYITKTENTILYPILENG
jgi:hypothetical protein